MGAQAELGHVALADDDRATGPDPRHADGIPLGHMLGKQRRTHAGGHPGGGRQVLDRLGHAVHPAHGLALGQLPVSLVGLLQQGLGVPQRDQGIDQWIAALDLRQVGLHHFAAGQLAGMDGPGQRQGIQVDNRRIDRWFCGVDQDSPPRVTASGFSSLTASYMQ